MIGTAKLDAVIQILYHSFPVCFLFVLSAWLNRCFWCTKDHACFDFFVRVYNINILLLLSPFGEN